MRKTPNIYAVIMAGGGGTRFWPWSREKQPKQMLPILSSRSMIQETVERILPLVPPERVLIVTSRRQLEKIRKEVPGIPKVNFLAEPVGRNTAPCLCLGALQIRKLDPQAVMIALPADHYISNPKGFLQTLKAAAGFAAARDFLVTLGVRPTEPETGYGYIQKGDAIGRVGRVPVFRVRAFREKPKLAQAKAYLRRGDSLWNSGIFIWKAGIFLQEVERCLPRLYRRMLPLETSLGTPRAGRTLAKVYPSLDPISVDYGVMEKAENVALVEARFPWSDVGSFAALGKVRPRDKNGNTLIPGRSGILALDSSNCLIRGEEKLIAVLGLKDLVVVEAGNALLVCPRERAQDVRLVLDELKKRGWKEYL